MNAHSTFTNDGVSFRQLDDDSFEIWCDGSRDTIRTITRQGTEFIAWIGFMSRHWCFSRALKACAEHIRFCVAEELAAVAAHEEAIASLMRMTEAEKARLIAKLQQERDGLDYAESEVDVVGRKALLDRQIAGLRDMQPTAA